MLAIHARDILVERDGQCSDLWVAVRGNDANPADEDDVRMIVDALRRGGGYLRFSILVEALGPDFEIRQDVTDDVCLRHELPSALPVIAENLANGRLFVMDRDGRRVDRGLAAKVFKEALTWCADDYSDLMPEFRDMLLARLKKSDYPGNS